MASWAGVRRLSGTLSTRARVLLVMLLAAIVILAGLYTQRETIRGLLFGTHFVGGDPATTNLHLPPGFSATVYASGLMKCGIGPSNSDAPALLLTHHG